MAVEALAAKKRGFGVCVCVFCIFSRLTKTEERERSRGGARPVVVEAPPA